MDLKSLTERVVAASQQVAPIEARTEKLGACSTAAIMPVCFRRSSNFGFRSPEDSLGLLYKWYEERQSTIDPVVTKV